MVDFDKYYRILELNNNATQDEIKKAYKRLAIKYHPDKNSENKEECEAKFKEISEAHEVLTNKDKYVNTNRVNFRTPNINPHDLFQQIFKDMHMQQSNVSINIPNINNHSTVMRSSTIRIQNGKHIETIRETINGQTRETTVIKDIHPGGSFRININ